MGANTAKERSSKPLAYLKAWAKTGDDPRTPFKAGTRVFQIVLEKAGLTIDQIDLFEVHEAFASQCLYNIKTLGFQNLWDRINVNGSGFRSVILWEPFWR
jgi:acetyl-CoA acetyltransferase